MDKRNYYRLAFTLIELSIVLVIIGLIVGGVLVGKDLINAATIRKVISEQESIKLAISTFKLKYNCFPGDCSNSTQFFTVDNANGNGNGVIETTNLGGGLNEASLIPRQLGLAGLVSGTYQGKLASGAQRYLFGGANATDIPSSYRVDSGYVFGWLSDLQNPSYPVKSNVITLQANNPYSNNSDATFVWVDDMINIDTKIDDGIMIYGTVRAIGGPNINSPIGSWLPGCGWGEAPGGPNYRSYDKTANCIPVFLLGN